MSRPSRYSNVFHLGHRRCELGLHSFIINLGVDEGFVNILAAGDTPIIILSVRDEEASIVLGLDLGADDYLTKPFRLRELISRMKAVLRRRGPVEAGDRTLACGDVTVVTQPLRPDMVVLQIGINDLTAVSLFPEETASRVVQCQNNLRQLVSQATAGGASVILTTIFPAGYLRLGYREFGLSEIGPLVIEVNNYLTILASPQVILFDAYTLLSENGLVKGEYSLDLLHLNSAGYDALSQSLTPLLLNLAQTRAAG